MNEVRVFDQRAAEYDRWFDEHTQSYQAEINALRHLLPATGLGVEIGAGTGRFSVPFGIRIGVEPARGMAQFAQRRGMLVCRALGEQLPFRDQHFDFALLITVVCFVPDVVALLREAKRIVKTGGKVIVGFIDKESALGKVYQSIKESDPFYKEAYFYSVPEMIGFLYQVELGELQFRQTIFGLPSDDPALYQVRDGYGEGAFVVISATNRSSHERHA